VLSDSDDPLVAGMANAVASYLAEYDDDLDGAVRAAERMLTAFAGRAAPWMLAVSHSRLGELSLQLDQPRAAQRHFRAALLVGEEVGAWASAARVRWGLVLATLQLGAVDEAEHWLEQAMLHGGDEAAGVELFDVAVRAEILLARGRVEEGLRLWRQVADHLRHGADPWTAEVQAVTVVAHARHGRLDLVEEITDDLPHLVSTMIEHPPGSFADFPILGALLLALAAVDLDRGDARSGARLTALAERFRFVRGFQPTMSAARARETASSADQAAYDEAVSSYADLGPGALRAAAAEALASSSDRVGTRPAPTSSPPAPSLRTS
jgi:hypothetical protein